MDAKAWCCILVTSVSCYDQHCYNANIPNTTSYEVNPTLATPGYGIPVDDPKGELDLAVVDGIVKATLACLEPLKTEALTLDEKAKGDCQGDTALEIRPCLKVKVPEWHVSKCSGKQLFPCSVPDASCEAKGITPTKECPCGCRGMVQDDCTIVTTPNLELFPGRLTEILTSCTNPWAVKRIEQCAAAFVGDK